MFIFKPQLSSILSYLGVNISILGIYFALSERFEFSLICLIAATVCDLFDGKLARMFERSKNEKKFGIELDSLADTINFMALPTVIMLQLFNSPLTVLVMAIYVACGITRLGVFNVMADEDKPQPHFRGVPTPTVALLLPILFLVRPIIPTDLYQTISLSAVVLLAFLFVVNIKIRKPTGRALEVILLLATMLCGGLIYASL